MRLRWVQALDDLGLEHVATALQPRCGTDAGKEVLQTTVAEGHKQLVIYGGQHVEGWAEVHIWRNCGSALELR